jgi:hypothetical protein
MATWINREDDELVTDGFTWIDSSGNLHIPLGTLENKLNEVGLAIINMQVDRIDLMHKAAKKKLNEMTDKELFDLAVRAGVYEPSGKLTKPYR